MLNIKVVNKSPFPLPSYSTALSAGVDLRAHVNHELVLEPNERRLIPTGLHIELPEGYEAQIRPRSGLALKQGITVLNSPGTIDADYRGEIGVILINLGQEAVKIEPGDRIAQMVVAPYSQVTFTEKNELETSTRGEKGFGSSGKN